MRRLVVERSEITAKQAIRTLVDQLNVYGVLYAQVNKMLSRQQFYETSEKLSDETLALALAETIRRLSYDLYYLITGEGGEITKLDLEVLGEAVKEICSEYFEEEKLDQLFTLFDWNGLLNLCLMELQFFQNIGNEKIGEDYFYDLVLEGVVNEVSADKVVERIDKFIDEVRRNVIQAMLSSSLEENLLDMVEAVREAVQSRCKALNDAEAFYDFLFAEIQRVCDERCLDQEESLELEEHLREVIPQVLTEYSPLIESRAIFFLEKLAPPMSFKIVMPHADAIWQALLDIYFYKLEENLAPSLAELEAMLDSILMAENPGNRGSNLN